MPLFKKNQRYKVSRKSDFIQVVTLLDGSQMECNLSADSLPIDCLENVLQRLEVAEVGLFGLKYFTSSGQLRWADVETPLKKQLQKHASSHILYIGIFYYIDRAYALQDAPTRYQFYLQLKADVLDSKLYCSLEQAILLAGYALQAEYQNYDDARRSDDYIKEIERLDSTLLPRNLVAEYEGPSALADIAQHIVSSHMTLSGLSSSQAEVAYIHLAQQMDGCGLEYVKVLSVDREEVYLGSTSTGMSVRRSDGHVKQQFNWSQISDLICNKKSLQVNITNKKLSTKFILDDLDSAKYVHSVFQLQQEFFHDDHSHLLYSDDELAAQQDNSEPLLSPTRHAAQLSNLSNSVIYESRPNRENAVDVIEEEPALETSTRDIPDMVADMNGEVPSGATPDLLNKYENDYATMKFNKDPISERPRAMTASLYAGRKETPMLDELHKNDLLHRSMTALQEYRDSIEEQASSPATAENFLSASPRAGLYAQYAGSADQLNTHSSHNIATVLSRSMHGLELSSHHQSGLPSYRPSPDYEMVMRERAMYAHAYMPEAYQQQQTVRQLQNGSIPPDPRSMFTQYASTTNQSDLPPTHAADSKEPLYANLEFPALQGHQSESAGAAIDRNQQPTPYQNHHGCDSSYPGWYYQRDHLYQRSSSAVDAPSYPRPAANSPDLLSQHLAGSQAPDLTATEQTAYLTAGSPDVISKRYLNETSLPHITGSSRRRSNPLRENRPSTSSRGNSSRSSSGRGISSARGSKGASSMSNESAHSSLSPKASIDERVQGLEEKLHTDTIAAEYESLLKKRQPADCRVALRPENDARNRFPSVLPYEETRVRLIATNTNPHGYINASHIKMPVANEELTYIATQNPFDDTLQDFWQMIWMYDVSIIAMVTEVEERGTQKCPKYWPSVAGPQNAVSVNDLKIVLKHSASASNFTTSCLRVLKTSTKEQRTLWHIQYTDWHPLNGCPRDVHGFLALLDELNSVRLHIQTKKHKDSPRVLVHCSGGVGRSGVLILSDVMRKCLENNEKISVASTLKELRQQRMYIVQTLAQYKFVHEVLVHYLKGVRLI
ncbi:tyrosine-protein phosphatase non-receptor type 21-like isoform X2 [Watersipora subatra]|uniref:tyrosine-protein phosphatase non-receptor type 21-like isoform X2 n=1 Tax=Watersipora subatra TaxID=2589382 RepID=UPI00355AEB22